MHLQQAGSFFFASGPYYILLAIFVLLFILLLFLWRYRQKRRSDVSALKNRKATKVARKRLKQAEGFLNDQDEKAFFTEISQALWGYISDKFNIPLSDLSMDSVKYALLSKSVREDIIDEFLATLNNCEYARFAPGDKGQNMEKIYNEAMEIIIKTEKELK